MQRQSYYILSNNRQEVCMHIPLWDDPIQYGKEVQTCFLKPDILSSFPCFLAKCLSACCIVKGLHAEHLHMVLPSPNQISLYVLTPGDQSRDNRYG